MEIFDRDDKEEEMLWAVLALWEVQRKRFEDEPDGTFWSKKETEDRELLAYWLAALFVYSASQHGVTADDARAAGISWAGVHSGVTISRMRKHSQSLLGSKNPAENIFGSNRARRFVTTEFTDAQSAGSDYAKEIQGLLSGEDLWYARNPTERRCPYCGRLHLQPRKKWSEIYYTEIIPNNPEMAVYGVPTRPMVHPNCNCFILYVGESSDEIQNKEA